MLAPVLDEYNQREAAATISNLQDKFGAEAVAAAKDDLARQLQADPDFYADPATRQERLEMTLAASLFEQQRAYDSGADIVDSVSATQSGRDLFGAINQSLVQPEMGETQPQYEARMAAAYRTQQTRPTHPDPEVAAIDAAGARRDIFG